MAKNVALILAAGSGTRMQGSTADKILAPIAGEPVVCYSVRAFISSGVCDQITIVYKDSQQRKNLEAAIAAIDFDYTWVQGGKERQDSVFNALLSQPDDCEYIFIHDCARPLISTKAIQDLYTSVKMHSASVLARPVSDTIKRVTSTKLDTPNELEDLDRSRLWAMETPQAFSYTKICEAYEQVIADKVSVTDDCAAASYVNIKCCIVTSDEPNPKITTASDLDYITWLVEQR
ncbi:MAG: 2-C-methyl-D-erythritol 4-phosphate cytidylyltransferase [Puniceicoccaceae bacterium]|nr:2-C-methyl-D-erythritol 4-phosphate cytidylyltransferase [Puniceicoccaceae bacterium]